MKDSYPVTKKGYELLKKELKQLLSTDRPQLLMQFRQQGNTEI